LLLVGCTIANRNDLPPALVPFAEASRFVPAGMVSFAFFDHEVFIEGSRRELWAGRDFELPEDLGEGLSRTLYVGDFGEKGVEAADLRFEADADRVEIEGHACWHSTPGQRSEYRRTNINLQRRYDEWRAIVDGRYALLAHHRDVLAAAIRRRGELMAVLAPFGDLSFVPADATELVFVLPRPGEERVGSKPVPTEPMVFAFSAGPGRFEVFSRTTPHPDYHGDFAMLWVSPDPPVREIGTWRCQGDAVQGKELGTGGLRLLLFATLFGHTIFI